MLRAVFLSLALLIPAFAEDTSLVKVTDFWRVIGVSTNSTEPQPNWTELDYNDSSWPLLQSGFVTSFVFVPGAAEQTVLPQNVVTYCFRKTFEVADPGLLKLLALRIDYESGFVAYLNNVEISRRSLPTNTTARIPLGTPASPHSRGPTEVINVSSAIPLLQPGANVLAIQLHSAGDDLPSLMMVVELAANFTRGPFVENMTTNSVQVIWHTVTPSAGSVTYGPDVDHLQTVSIEIPDTIHAVTLTNLAPNQNYIYRVAVETGQETAFSDWSNFRTFKMPGAPITFLVVGDTGQAMTGQYKIADQMKLQPADLLIHVGDVVYPCFNATHVDARCFSIYHDQMRNVPFFFCLGNHDSYCGSRTDYLNAFYLPTNTVTGTEIYYSFDHGAAHFVILDTDTQFNQRYDPDSAEYKWLEADLAASKQPWKFLFFHHVIRSSSIHSTDDFLFDGVYDKYALQAYIGGLATKYGAQVIFNGHDHDYERFATFEGYNSFISGGGGASLYGQSFQEQGSVQFYTRNNFLKITLNDPDLTVEAIDENGAIFDRFYRSRAPGAATFAATFDSPPIESASGSDLAGNIPGQTFHFAGPSIRTRAGQRANLGHVHVRNDQNFFYVGFENATIWRDQVIALFLENPDQPGITALDPLGNGVIDDANGEGADGLDLLGALLFRNFHPSIACLLGDERADLTQRNFKRANMRWATGQGVFHLDQTFTSVPGARLQQFNRSPQTAVPLFPDANADFIEVAIPLYELGNPQYPGAAHQIKLGAIAFADPASGPMAPQIDTAVAGASLDPDADGHVILEPITIQLAADPNPFHDAFAFTATLIPDARLRFEWNSVPGGVYVIQSSPALGEPFQDIAVRGLPLTAAGNRISFDLPIDSAAQRFYRLRAN
jgi:predicted phosphodiesterase